MIGDRMKLQLLLMAIMIPAMIGCSNRESVTKRYVHEQEKSESTIKRYQAAIYGLPKVAENPEEKRRLENLSWEWDQNQDMIRGGREIHIYPNSKEFRWVLWADNKGSPMNYYSGIFDIGPNNSLVARITDHIVMEFPTRIEEFPPKSGR